MSFQLTIEPTGEVVEVEEGQSLLDACLRAGIYLPYACNHGLCGTCKVQVVEGEIEHNEASSFALMDLERAEGKCLACVATLSSDCVIEADVEEEPDAQHHPVQDLKARVVRLADLTPTVKGVWLELPAPGLSFQAGQYVNVSVPGVAGPRAFSIASAPSSPTLLELNVRKVDGGAATTYLHEQVQVGDTFAISGPLGRFFVRESAHLPMIFLAGGSGVSSPKSMILDLLERGNAQAITLVYGARNRDELYDHDLFESLAAAHANFRYVPVLGEASADWTGLTGMTHDAANEAFAKRFSEHKAYLCGPPLMIEACISALMQGRLFERDIYTEKFLSAADGAEGLARSPLFRRL